MVRSLLLRRWRAAGLTLGLTTTLGLSGGLGCSSAPPGFRLLLEFVVAPRTNQNSPVPLSLVAVNDPKLFEKIEAMTAKQWFEQREQIRRDFPGGQAFTEWEWEYVPGQAPPPIVVEIDGRAVGALIFANYRAPGDHRFRMGPQQRMRIDVGDEDLVLTPLDAPAE